MGTPVIAYIWHPRSHHKVGRDQSHTEKDVSVGMTPSKALKWVEDNMIPYYPLGIYKDRSAQKEAQGV